MIIAISQPTFLPYEGYFALINNVEKFIFLDTVDRIRSLSEQFHYVTLVFYGANRPLAESF